jgi:hypothetical protein
VLSSFNVENGTQLQKADLFANIIVSGNVVRLQG